MSDYYELLHVSRNADADEIKKAYRRLARQYHPDSAKSHVATEHMKLLNEAYNVLSDPLKRRQYDEHLAAAAFSQEAFSGYAGAAPPAPGMRPWLLWIGVTAVLIVAAFIGTLFAMRSQLSGIGASLFATPTRIPVVAPTLAPTWTATATPSPVPSPTPPPTPSSTPSATPSATATRLPPTPTATATPARPTPTRAATGGALPLPTFRITGNRLATSEPAGSAGATDIFIGAAEGGVKINLTRTEGQIELSPSWSPSGQSIVFSEFNSGNLFIMAADGSQRTQLTSDPLMRDSNPVWSPSGTQVAFHSISRSAFAAGNTQAYGVFVVDVNTRQRRQVADQPGQELAWSPDGLWLAYRVQTATNSTLYVASASRPTVPFYFYAPRIRRLAWTLDSRQVIIEGIFRDTNGDSKFDDQDRAELYEGNLMPFGLQRLTGTVSVVSARGRFPGAPTDGDYYPPVISIVQQ